MSERGLLSDQQVQDGDKRSSVHEAGHRSEGIPKDKVREEPSRHTEAGNHDLGLIWYLGAVIGLACLLWLLAPGVWAWVFRQGSTTPIQFLLLGLFVVVVALVGAAIVIWETLTKVWRKMRHQQTSVLGGGLNGSEEWAQLRPPEPLVRAYSDAVRRVRTHH